MFCQASFDQWLTTIMRHLPHLSKPQALGLALWSFGMVLARSCALTAFSLLLAAGMHRKEQTVRQEPGEGSDDQAREQGGHGHKPYPGVGLAELIDQSATQDNQRPRR